MFSNSEAKLKAGSSSVSTGPIITGSLIHPPNTEKVSKLGWALLESTPVSPTDHSPMWLHSILSCYEHQAAYVARALGSSMQRWRITLSPLEWHTHAISTIQSIFWICRVWGKGTHGCVTMYKASKVFIQESLHQPPKWELTIRLWKIKENPLTSHSPESTSLMPPP